MAAPVSYKAEVIAEFRGVWTGNGQRFATEEEALTAAKGLSRRWMAVREWRVVSSQDPANYRWDDDLGRAVRIED